MAVTEITNIALILNIIVAVDEFTDRSAVKNWKKTEMFVAS
jgi:hypothetical protein